MDSKDKSLIAPIVTATGKDAKVLLTWTSVLGADRYEVVRTDEKQDAKIIYDGPKTRLVDDQDVQNGKLYEYDVIAHNKTEQGPIGTAKAVPSASVASSPGMMVPPAHSQAPVSGSISHPATLPMAGDDRSLPQPRTRTERVKQRADNEKLSIFGIVLALIAIALAIWLGWCKSDSTELADTAEQTRLNTLIAGEIRQNKEQQVFIDQQKIVNGRQQVWNSDQQDAMKGLLGQISAQGADLQKFHEDQLVVDSLQDGRLDALEDWKKKVVAAAKKQHKLQKERDLGQDKALGDHSKGNEDALAKLQAQIDALGNMPEIVVEPPTAGDPITILP